MKICIDPGHGMSNRSAGVYDPGASHVEDGRRYDEADIALDYALTLDRVLRDRGYDVFLTRQNNTDTAPVGRRAIAAAQQGCALFLSVHLNDVENDQANGTETLYDGAENRDLALRMQAALVQALGLRDRGPKERSNLAVLRFDGPAVLLELGFIGNDRDRNRLLSPAARAAACEAIAAELDRIRKVASSQEAQMDLPEGKEADDDPTGRTHYDPGAPAFATAARQDRASFTGAFTALGVRDSFDFEEFAAVVAGWGLTHFTANELLKLGSQHYGAGLCGGRNSLPPKTLWPEMQQTARLADAIRAEFGRPIIVLSGYRDVDYNRCIGGAENSQHRRFNALDIANVGGTTSEMHRIARRLMEDTEFAGGLGAYFSRGFIHIDTRGSFVSF